MLLAEVSSGMGGGFREAYEGITLDWEREKDARKGVSEAGRE